MVRSTDNSSAGAAFDMDPFYLFEDAPSPYAFFGINPTLFDAPSRGRRDSLDWTAHSHLAWTPMDDTERRVLPLAGFSWGCDVDSDSRITLQPVQALSPGDWRAGSKRLRTSCRASARERVSLAVLAPIWDGTLRRMMRTHLR
ncbi:hypothetical protein OG244_06825 [Streptomyces brevispora]|uniref:hypothetical protein n=1 Tax=Streptomyces brevispora TaxID=887462 RepID=UPI002E369BC3|nr:hypothetical protein [Streptomyces brevispora]